MFPRDRVQLLCYSTVDGGLCSFSRGFYEHGEESNEYRHESWVSDQVSVHRPRMDWVHCHIGTCENNRSGSRRETLLVSHLQCLKIQVFTCSAKISNLKILLNSCVITICLKLNLTSVVLCLCLLEENEWSVIWVYYMVKKRASHDHLLLVYILFLSLHSYSRHKASLILSVLLLCLPEQSRSSVHSPMFCVLVYVFVYLWVFGPTLWQTAHLPVCSGSMLIRCCSCPGCEGHGSGPSQSCAPERRPQWFGPGHFVSAARSGEMSTGSDLPEVRHTYIMILTLKTRFHISNEFTN